MSFSKRHYQRVSPAPATPEQVAETIRYREAGQRANREMMDKFAPLTPENAAEAIGWQQQRIAELMCTVLPTGASHGE